MIDMVKVMEYMAKYTKRQYCKIHGVRKTHTPATITYITPRKDDDPDGTDTPARRLVA